MGYNVGASGVSDVGFAEILTRPTACHTKVTQVPAKRHLVK